MSDATASPRLVGVGGLFIDDIVRPDGRTYMGELGGGVVHALMSAAIWGERPGLVAPMGEGFPAESLALLRATFDARGVYAVPLPQARTWEIFEEDGTRRELYRVANIAPFVRGPQPADVPPAFRSASGFYLLQDCESILAWRAAVTGLVLWEPLQQVMIPASRDAFRRALRKGKIDIVSPNLAEAQAIYGPIEADALVARMLDDGACTVALRLGAAGSLVRSRGDAGAAQVPAVALAQIVDETGAGNSYCGGLLWGLVAGKSLREAAVAGAVAASFCLESVGVIKPARVTAEERDRRYRTTLAAVR